LLKQADDTPQHPLVSVIVAVYEGRETIDRCLRSVLAQTHPGCELIVIDGGSRDGTVDVIREHAGRIAFWESEPDRGISHAWNKALSRARGEWLLFLGADDELYSPDTLSRVGGSLRDANGSLLVYGQVQLKGGPWDGLVAGGRWSEAGFRRRMTVPHQAAFHRRALFERFGQFDESLSISADYEMLLRAGAELKPSVVEEIIAVMGGEGRSMRQRVTTWREARSAQIRHRVNPRVVIEAWYRYYRMRTWLNAIRGR
jgi:glycosyltransferase involved in cell wall biosynthesis